MTSFDALDLRAGHQDMVQWGAYLSNLYFTRTMLAMGHLAPHGQFVHVFLNGDYWGQYHLRERWNAAMFASYYGHEEGDYEAIDGDNQGADFSDGEVYQGSGDAWRQVIAATQSPRPFEELQNLVDLENYIDFVLLWSMGSAEPEFQAAGAPSRGIPFQFHLKDADGFFRVPLASIKTRGPAGILKALLLEDNPRFWDILRKRCALQFRPKAMLSSEKSLERFGVIYTTCRSSIMTECIRWQTHSELSWQRYNKRVESTIPLICDQKLKWLLSAEWKLHERL